MMSNNNFFSTAWENNDGQVHRFKFYAWGPNSSGCSRWTFLWGRRGRL